MLIFPQFELRRVHFGSILGSGGCLGRPWGTMCGPRAQKSKKERKIGSKWVRFGSLFGNILGHFLDQSLSPFLKRFSATFGPILEAPRPRKCGNYRMKRMSPIFGQRAVWARFLLNFGLILGACWSTLGTFIVSFF